MYIYIFIYIYIIYIYIVKPGNSRLLVIPDIQCKSIEKFQIVRTYQQSMPSRKQSYSSY